MKEFVTPTLIDLDINETAEGNFSGSGAHNPDPTASPVPTEPPKCWNISCHWESHNSGGHSECQFVCTHNGDHGGSVLTIYVSTNFPIEDFTSDSGVTITNKNTYGFTIIRNNTFNRTESVIFNICIKTSEVYEDADGNKLHGAIGANNEGKYYCTIDGFSCN